MKSLLFLLFILFAMVFLLGAFFSVFIFVFDVIKWKDREERVVVDPATTINHIHESLSASDSFEEVNSNAVQSGQSDTSAFFDSWN